MEKINYMGYKIYSQKRGSRWPSEYTYEAYWKVEGYGNLFASFALAKSFAEGLYMQSLTKTIQREMNPSLAR